MQTSLCCTGKLSKLSCNERLQVWASHSAIKPRMHVMPGCSMPSSRCQPTNYAAAPGARKLSGTRNNVLLHDLPLLSKAMPHWCTIQFSGRQLSGAALSLAGVPACWMAWAVTCATQCMRPSAPRSAAATGSASRGSASESCLNAAAVQVLCWLQRCVQCSGSHFLQRVQVLPRVLRS